MSDNRVSEPVVEIEGYAENPQFLVQKAFEDIAAASMHHLSFLHPDMPVYATQFQLIEGQWFGCIITPWMLSALILPGPNQLWPERQLSERMGIALPYGDMTFTVGKLEGIEQYLTSSIMSPIDRHLSAKQGVQLAKDCARMLLSMPVNSQPNQNLRDLLTGKRKGL